MGIDEIVWRIRPHYRFRKAMKILFLARLLSPHIGGVEKHVMEISKILIKRGHEVTVITEKYSDKLSSKEKINGIHVYRINTGRDDWFRKFRIWKEMWRLKKVIFAADVIHCHDVFFWYLPFRFFTKKKVFTTFHGYETVFPVSQKAKFVRKISEKLSMGNICVGDFIKKWYGTNPIFVTYGGVSISKNAQFTSPNKSNLKIAFLGRLDVDTGIIFYKQTIQFLKERKIRLSFDIYGEGPQKKEVLGIGTVYGFVPDTTDVIREADIVFVSSYLSILETMAQKKMVFATFSNPLKEDYLKMSPFAKFIIIEKDPLKMAEKIEFYLKNPKETQHLIDRGYEWVNEQTWEKVTAIYLRLWIR